MIDASVEIESAVENDGADQNLFQNSFIYNP